MAQKRKQKNYYVKKFSSNEERRQYRSELFKNNNPMHNEKSKEIHKKSVQKKDRPEWRANSSKSLKGKRVGGAAKPGQVSDSVKKRWADPNSIYNSLEYRKKLSDAQLKPETFKKRHATISKNNKFMSIWGSKIQKAVYDELLQYFPDCKYNFPIELSKRNVVVDIFIPSKKLIVEVLGCYWHGHYPSECSYKNLHSPDKQRRLEMENEIRTSKIWYETGFRVIPIWECLWKQPGVKRQLLELVRFGVEHLSGDKYYYILPMNKMQNA